MLEAKDKKDKMRGDFQRAISSSATAILLMLPAAVFAQDATALAKQTQNPVSSLISVPFQGNWDFGIGDNDATSTLLNIQPVVLFTVAARSA